MYGKDLAKRPGSFDHNGSMYRDQWIKFTWDIKALPAFEPQLRASMRIRKAVDDDPIDKIWGCTERAFEMDQGWSVNLKQILERLEQSVRKGLDGGEKTALLLEDGKRFVGVSVIDPKNANGPHLVTGICVEDEYRCRGYGTALLHATLTALSEAGLAEAYVLSRVKVNASKYLYPKFGSKSAPLPESEIPYKVRG